MSRLSNLDAFIQSQPTNLSEYPELAQLLRVDLLLCRQFVREANLLREPSPTHFFQTVELLTLKIQHLEPTLTQACNDYWIFLDNRSCSLLEAMSLYHSLGLIGAYNKPSNAKYVHYYLQQVRPHFHKLVSGITGEVGLQLMPAMSPQVQPHTPAPAMEEVPF